MESVTKPLNALDYINVNDADFYNNLQDEIEIDLARIKKSVEVVRKLRLAACEMEVDTAALFHAELWRDIEDLKMVTVTKENKKGVQQ